MFFVICLNSNLFTAGLKIFQINTKRENVFYVITLFCISIFEYNISARESNIYLNYITSSADLM